MSSGTVASLAHIKHYKELDKGQSYWSTTLYKRYNNYILLQIEEHNLGTNIGTTNVGAPTVADAISMLPSTPIDTQVMLNTVVNNAKQDKVNFNASKSDIIIYNQPNAPTLQWDMGEDKIESSNSTTLRIAQGKYQQIQHTAKNTNS